MPTTTPARDPVTVDPSRLALLWGFVLALAVAVGVVISEYSIERTVDAVSHAALDE